MNVSRGNPRSSSVGEEKDVEEVRYRSTSKLDPSLIVEIEDCGIPLDCSSPGDSFQPQDPCELDLTLHNVMGQEDLFRQENGERVERGGVARIIVTTNRDAIIKRIEYDRAPQDDDNPVFDSSWDPAEQNTTYHETFVNVSPGTLYAFKVILSRKDCDEEVVSNIYYFNTRSEVTRRTSIRAKFFFDFETLTVNTYNHILSIGARMPDDSGIKEQGSQSGITISSGTFNNLGTLDVTYTQTIASPLSTNSGTN